MDGLMDDGDTARTSLTFPAVASYVGMMEYDRLGASYFRGLVYTNQYVYATNDITVLGSVLAQGDSSFAPELLPDGTTANPGDLIMDNGTRVTFVEDFFSSSGPPVGGSVTVETWIGR